jgi:Fis family transcriptional regulator, factor for inversion stimulation protein
MSTAENTLVDSRFINTSTVSPITTVEKSAEEQSLRACVETTMENYFRHLDGQTVSDVYNMVLAEVEAPLLEVVMKNTRQNQTKASEILGLNRGTLRKKLKQYGLL